MRLSSAARAILGTLSLGESSGYDIKALIDDVAPFFWNVSYGGLYPELKALEEAGLVMSRDEARGGRARSVFSLTHEGRAALEDWLHREEEPLFELRDEGLLKLAFAETLGAQAAIGIVDRMRTRHERLLRKLTDAEQGVVGLRYGHLIWEGGIELHEWILGWCARTEGRLRLELDGAEPA